MLKKSEININLIIVLYTFLLMLFCTNSSPLVNIASSDSGVFFTIGRAMTKGKIVFKELFDHKGWYLYLFNYIAALISYKSTFGLFIVESIFMSISAVMTFKICSIFHNDKKASFLAVTVLLFLALRHDTFEGGNLTEEYSLAFILISIYLLLKDLYLENASHKSLYMFIHGIMVGIVMGLRPNATIIWLPIALFVGIDLLFKKREIKLFFMNAIYGIFGLLTGLAPMLIYCIMNDALKDMLFCTFGFNMLYLDGGTNFTVLLKRCIGAMARESQRILFVTVLISAFFILYDRKCKSNYNKLYYFTMLSASIIAVSLSGRRYGHYYEYIIPFCLPAVCEISAKVVELKHINQLNYRYRYLFAVIFAATCLSSAVIPQKLLAITGVYQSVGINIAGSMDKVIQACNQINREKYYSPDEKILLIRSSPEFYPTMDIIPQEKYFYVPSIPYSVFPDAVDAQINSILSCKNDVIIIKYKDDTKAIFPDANRDDEIKNTLDTHYDLLLWDEEKSLAMYGKKLK